MADGGGDGELSFDFEDELDAAAAVVVPPAPGDVPGAAANGRGGLRQTVCRQSLRGLCMKGDSCGFLHQHDEDRMPVCRFFRGGVFKRCDKPIMECSMYNMGFCPNGPYCRYRHVKQPGPPPPVEEIFQKLQEMNLFNYGSSNSFYQHQGNSYNQQRERSQVQPWSMPHNQSLAASSTPVMQQPAPQHVPINPRHVPPPQQPQQNAQVQGAPKGSSNQATINANPLPQGQSRYPVVKSCNRENLEISVQQGVWASRVMRLDEVWRMPFYYSRSIELVISRAVQRLLLELVATLVVGIGNMLTELHYDQNFSLPWLQLMRQLTTKTYCYLMTRSKREAERRMLTMAKLLKDRSRAMWRQPHMPILRVAGWMLLLLLLFWRR